MSELSYSISESGTHAQNMTASGMSNFMLQSTTNAAAPSKVDQCLDDFLGDVFVSHNQESKNKVINVFDEQQQKTATDVNLA